MEVVRTIKEARINSKETAILHKLIEHRRRIGKTTQIEWERGHDQNNRMNGEAIRATRRGRRDGEVMDEQLEEFDYRTRRERRSRRTERTMTEWQEDWNMDTRGRMIHRWCRQIGTDRIDIIHKATQVLIGHGNTLGYLKKFNLRETEGKCDCGQRKEEDIQHILYRCNKETRVEARTKIQQKYNDLEIQLRRNNRADNVTNTEVE